MLTPIKYDNKVQIKGVPIQWIPKLELYYPDLPQFPISYIHILCKNERIYGFIASHSIKIADSRTCNIELLFLSNFDLETNSEIKKIVIDEIEERIGYKDKVGINEIIGCCNDNKDYIAFFKELWKYISKTFGEYIPYGKFYEEIYSIVRFVSAWQPKTGRQSEMRMLYNFLSIFGEEVKVEGDWKHLEFFLLPTYKDVKEVNLSLFPKFKSLHKSMNKIWDIFFSNSYDLDGMKIRYMDKSWPQKKDEFMKKVTHPIYKSGKINLKERQDIDRLVDAFNRHSWRAAFFIWSIMSIQEKDYLEWDKEFFDKFYLIKKLGVGISPKVIACFLQQGFKNEEAIPIDIWVESFYELSLGIESKEEFFNSFSKRGKLERAIWLSSQANKTNIKTFFDLMWCTRYGVTGNRELRGPNPISCYECKLISKCPSYNKIKDKKVYLSEEGKIENHTLFSSALNEGCLFVCQTKDAVPKKVFEYTGRKWILVDEFSGYLLTNQKTHLPNNKTYKVDDIIMSLPNLFN